jgi:outer membrane protein assembly factor BamB
MQHSMKRPTTGHLGSATRRRSTCAPFTVPLHEAKPRRVADGVAQAPLVCGDRLVFMSTASGSVTALDAASGATLWSRKVMAKAAAAIPHEAGLIASDSSVWVRAKDKLLELDLATGEVKSRVACGRLNLFDSVLVGDCIVGPDHWGDLGIVATSLNGKMRWNQTAGFVPDPLAANDDVVLVLDGGHGLIACNIADGSLRWRIEGRTQAAGATSSIGAAVIASDTQALAVVDRDITSFDLVTGAVQWRVPLLEEPGALPRVTVTDEGDVFVVGRTRIERRTLATGELAMERDEPFGRSASPFTLPCVTPEHLVCANMTGLVAVVARASLEVVWSVDLRSRRGIANWPVVAAGKIFATSFDGALDVLE